MLKPLHDRIIVLAEKQNEAKHGSILLPDTAQEKPQRGKVLAVGPGRLLDNGKRADIEVKVDDTVLYGKYSGTEIKLKGEAYLILRQDEVLAIVK